MTKVAKKKIASIAKEYEVPSETLVRLLQNAGVEVHSSHSSIDKESFQKIKEDLVKEQDKLSKKKTSVKKIVKNTAKDDSKTKSANPFGGKAVIKKTKKAEEPASNSGGGMKSKLKVTLKKTTKEEAAEAEASRAVVKKVAEAPKAKPAPEASAPAKSIEEKLAKKESPFKEKAPSAEESKAPVAEAPKAAPKQDPKPSAKAIEKKTVSKAAPKAAPVEETSSQKQLKVKVEKPTDEMAARIAKYAADQKARQQAARSGNRGGGGRGGNGSGYTGQMSRSTTGGQGGGNRGPGGPGGNRGPGGPGGNRGPGGPGGNRGQTGGQGAMAAAFGQRGPGGGNSPAPGAGAGGMPIPPVNPNAGNHGNKSRGKKKKNVKVIAEKTFESKANVNKVMATLAKNPTKKVYRKEDRKEDENAEERKVLQVSDFVTVSELAGLMKVPPARVIAKCMEMGMMVTINFRLEFETIQLLADEFEFDAELMEEYEEDNFDELDQEVDEGELEPRAPVVTVMGHVDHGKTSLLDWIRKEKVASGEAGGITQHVGAYSVFTEKGYVTFLDTPGHEAFSSMRARGSQITDVIVLVVAADDRVMPQTVESIEHAKAAGVPIVVAITKCDLETANTDKIRAQLAERGIEVEQWGGKTSCMEVSSKTGLGMEELLETLALETEVLELKANPVGNAKGTVIESKVEKGRGSVATVLIQSGALRVGDTFVSGIHFGRVKALLNDSGEPIDACYPGFSCQVMGIEGAPMSGDKLVVTSDEKDAREIAGKRRMAAKERELRSRQHMTLDQLYDRVKAGNFTQLNLIVKADTNGSVEAIASELDKMSNKEVGINIVRKAVGNLNASDIMLAAASDAIIIAFHILPDIKIRNLADAEGVEIKTARVIYHLLEEFESVMEGMLKPTIKEEVAGEAEVKQLFKVPKQGFIAGSVVTNGTVALVSKLRIYRAGLEVGKGNVSSLRRHKEEVEAVKSGTECGIGISGFDDLQIGDTLAFFREVEIKRTLKDIAK